MPVKRNLKRSSSMMTPTNTKRAKLVLTTRSASAGKPGVVLTLGMGELGQLGLGDDIMQRNRPSIVAAIDEDIEVLCAGGMHTICVTSAGKAITFGCNDEGALGRDTSVKGLESEPGAVELDARVVQVSAGDSHSAALLEDGRVYAWGSFRDSKGSMGLTMNGIQKLPLEFLPGEKVVKIASGADHLVMLTEKGQMFTCGCGEQGQLGRVAERAASRDCRQGLLNLLVPGLVSLKPRAKRVDDIWAASHVTYFKCQEDIYVFGLNNYMQLGLADGLNRFHPTLVPSFSLPGKSWVQICGGQHHTIARDSEGTVYALGRYEYGRLGLGKDSGDAVKPTVIPSLAGKKCIDIACGTAVSLAVTEEGAVFGWGMATNAQLGNGDDDTDIYEPQLIVGKQLESRAALRVSAGGQHTTILATK